MIQRIIDLPFRVKYSVFGVIVLCTLLLKVYFFDFQYVDYVAFLSKWILAIQENRGFSALAKPFYNYTPMYMYFLVAIAKLEQWFDINTLYAIKILSIFFEYILAYFIGKIASLYCKNDIYMWLSLLVVPLIPAVLLDSSVMSQCDSLYTTFVVASIYFLLVRKPFVSVLLFGVAFSFKAQATFVLPFFFVYMLRGHIKWYYFLLVPVVYFISIIPTWMVGRSLLDLLSIYAAQSQFNSQLVLNFPNIYLWIGEYMPSNKSIYMFIYGVFVFCIGLILMKKRYTYTISLWFKLIFLSTLISPYFLPGMLDRYLYLADVFVVIYVFLNWRNLPIAVIIWYLSATSRAKSILDFAFVSLGKHNWDYYIFFENLSKSPMMINGLLFILVILYVAYDFVKELKESTVSEAIEESNFKI